MSNDKPLSFKVNMTDNNGNVYSGEINLQRKTKEKKKTLIITRKPSSSTPTSAVKEEYSKNFFRNKRSLNEVISKLSSKGFNFEIAQVSKALERAKYLKKEGKRQKFTYIQKYPA